MKKQLFVIGALLLASLPIAAQNRTRFSGIWNAIDYAYGLNSSVAPLTIDSGPIASGSQTVTVAFGNTTAGDGTVFAPLSTSAPISVGSGSDQETVTPSAVSCSTPGQYDTCTFTATFSNAHGRGEPIASGSWGLQEAALQAKGVGGGLVAVDWKWFLAEGLSSNANLTTKLATFNSVSANVTVLNYGGINGALSYSATAGSAYASTTHVIY